MKCARSIFVSVHRACRRRRRDRPRVKKELSMEFKEYVGGRWVMFLAGLVWTPVLPAAYALFFRELMRQNVALILLVTVCMALLLLAAVVLLKNGIAGLIANGKTRLILLDDSLARHRKRKRQDLDVRIRRPFEFLLFRHPRQTRQKDQTLLHSGKHERSYSLQRTKYRILCFDLQRIPRGAIYFGSTARGSDRSEPHGIG